MDWSYLAQKLSSKIGHWRKDIKGKVTGRQGKRRKQLLDDVKKKRGYWKVKQNAPDHTLWRTRFGRGYGPVEIQSKEWWWLKLWQRFRLMLTLLRMATPCASGLYCRRFWDPSCLHAYNFVTVLDSGKFGTQTHTHSHRTYIPLRHNLKSLFNIRIYKHYAQSPSKNFKKDLVIKPKTFFRLILVNNLQYFKN